MGSHLSAQASFQGCAGPVALLPVWAVAEGMIVGPVRLVVNQAGPEIITSHIDHIADCCTETTRLGCRLVLAAHVASDRPGIILHPRWSARRLDTHRPA